MRLFYRLAALARALVGNARVDADLAEELRFHVQRETEANIARGLSPERAYRQARLTVGSVDAALETARDQRPGSLFRQLGRDMRFGTRLLAKSPAFALAGLTVVALGIGAVAAIFSVVYGVMLRPLPFRDPGRLVSIWWSRGPSTGLTRMYPSAADVIEWRQSTRAFAGIGLVRSSIQNMNLVGAGEPERVAGARVSSNLLPVLGVLPAIGRVFSPDAGQPGDERVVILSDAFWRRQFAGDPSIVGRSIQLNGAPYAVIGVMPPEFQYPSRDYQLWLPIVFNPRELTRELTENYAVVARLRPGVTFEQADAEMQAIAKRHAAEVHPTWRVVLEPVLENAVHDVRAPLDVLLAASFCLLLIACLNLSNLFGARAASRSAEYSLRLALGASRGRLVAQAIAEVVPILAVGGALGVAAANVGVRAFVAASPPGVPRLESVAVNTPVILLSLGMLVVTGLIASLTPAIQAWRSDFTAMTKEGGRAVTTGRRRADARRLGVALQIAFAVPLLVGACLLIRSSLALAGVELGFDPHGVESFHVAAPRSKYPTDADVAAYYDRLLARVRAIPGVTNAGMVNRLPLAGNQTMSIDVERAPGSIVEIDAVDSRPVTPDYFATLRIPLRAGRTFTSRDGAQASPVVIVDERLARTMWPGQSALGKRVRFTGGAWSTVIGVVGHIRATSVDEDPRPQVYWSHHQVTQDRMVLVMRGGGSAAALAEPVVDAIRSVDRDQPVYEVRGLESVVARSLVRRRLTTTLISSFGAIALILAAVGIYGVVAYGVTQRRREFGIRVALGATRGDVSRLVLREGASMALIGSTAGLVAAFALSGMMRNLVFGIAPRDVVSFFAATLTLLAVAVVSSYVPARRASTIDPAVTLRAE